MGQRYKAGLLCWLLLLLLGWAVPPSTFADEPAPLVAAQHFLDRLDAGDYSGAWDLLDAYSRRLEESSHWWHTLSVVREAYGPLQQREPGILSERNSYFQHPDGAYVVACFRSRFAFKAAAVETVVLRLEPNGSLSVIRYVIN
jgi:hypothetical protein